MREPTKPETVNSPRFGADGRRTDQEETASPRLPRGARLSRAREAGQALRPGRPTNHERLRVRPKVRLAELPALSSTKARYRLAACSAASGPGKNRRPAWSLPRHGSTHRNATPSAGRERSLHLPNPARRGSKSEALRTPQTRSLSVACSSVAACTFLGRMGVAKSRE